MTIYERILAACCDESPIDVEAHAARILSVVVAAKTKQDVSTPKEAA